MDSQRELQKSENKNATPLGKWFFGDYLQKCELENGLLQRITKIRNQKCYFLRKVIFRFFKKTSNQKTDSYRKLPKPENKNATP